MQTLSFQAPEEMCKHLNECAKNLDRSKAYLIRAALEEYLQDMDDLIEAKIVKASYRDDDLVDFDEIKRQNNLD